MSQQHARLCFFFNDTATTEIYTLSLHDALPIFEGAGGGVGLGGERGRDPGEERQSALVQPGDPGGVVQPAADRKSTRLNSSHANISYAVFCLKKKTPIRFRH